MISFYISLIYEEITMKINDTVKKETAFVLGFTVVLCAIMQSLYLILGYFTINALIATLVSWLCSSVNFLLLGLTVQRAVEDSEENAKKRIKASQSLRTLMMLVVLVVTVIVLGYETGTVLAALIPLLFPRIAVTVRMLRVGREEGDK